MATRRFNPEQPVELPIGGTPEVRGTPRSAPVQGQPGLPPQGEPSSTNRVDHWIFTDRANPNAREYWYPRSVPQAEAQRLFLEEAYAERALAGITSRRTNLGLPFGPGLSDTARIPNTAERLSGLLQSKVDQPFGDSPQIGGPGAVQHPFHAWVLGRADSDAERLHAFKQLNEGSSTYLMWDSNSASYVPLVQMPGSDQVQFLDTEGFQAGMAGMAGSVDLALLAELGATAGLGATGVARRLGGRVLGASGVKGILARAGATSAKTALTAVTAGAGAAAGTAADEMIDSAFKWNIDPLSAQIAKTKAVFEATATFDAGTRVAIWGLKQTGGRTITRAITLIRPVDPRAREVANQANTFRQRFGVGPEIIAADVVTKHPLPATQYLQAVSQFARQAEFQRSRLAQTYELIARMGRELGDPRKLDTAMVKREHDRMYNMLHDTFRTDIAPLAALDNGDNIHNGFRYYHNTLSVNHIDRLTENLVVAERSLPQPRVGSRFGEKKVAFDLQPTIDLVNSKVPGVFGEIDPTKIANDEIGDLLQLDGNTEAVAQLRGLLMDISQLKPRVTSVDIAAPGGNVVTMDAIQQLEAIRWRAANIVHRGAAMGPEYTRLAGQIRDSVDAAIKNPINGAPVQSEINALSRAIRQRDEIINNDMFTRVYSTSTPYQVGADFIQHQNLDQVKFAKRVLPADDFEVVVDGWRNRVMNMEPVAALSMLDTKVPSELAALDILLPQNVRGRMKQFLEMKDAFTKDPITKMMNRGYDEANIVMNLVEGGRLDEVRAVMDTLGGPGSPAAAPLQAGVYEWLLLNSMVKKEGITFINPARAQKLFRSFESRDGGAFSKAIFTEDQIKQWDQLDDIISYLPGDEGMANAFIRAERASQVGTGAMLSPTGKGFRAKYAMFQARVTAALLTADWIQDFAKLPRLHKPTQAEGIAGYVQRFNSDAVGLRFITSQLGKGLENLSRNIDKERLEKAGRTRITDMNFPTPGFIVSTKEALQLKALGDPAFVDMEIDMRGLPAGERLPSEVLRARGGVTANPNP